MGYSTELVENLEKNGLQPFIYRASNKKGYYNNKYFENNKKITLGNSREILDYRKYFHLEEDSKVGIFLKNANIRDFNKGFFFLDFDLKGDDDIKVFNDIIEKLKEMGYWEQVEKKRNGNGFHLCLRAMPETIKNLEAQGKIYRGKESFVEILTAGKFLRLCPNDDYIIDDTEGKFIDFEKVKTISLKELISLSDNLGTDKILKQSIKSRTKKASRKVMESNLEIQSEFDDEDKNLVYSYIISHKMEYDEALKMTCGLGALHWDDVFISTIPQEKIREYQGLFEKSIEAKPKMTRYMKSIIKELRLIRDKKVVEGQYLDIAEIEKILKCQDEKHLVIAPTGTGKTFTFLHAVQKLGMKAIFTVPNVAVVKQFATKYNFVAPCHSDISFERAFQRANIIVCTIDKLAYCPPHLNLKEHTIIHDERHSHVTSADFRIQAIHFCRKISQKGARVIDVTATPEPLDFSHYNNFTTFHKKDPIKYDVKVITTTKRALTTLKILNETNHEKRIVLNNDIALNETYSETNERFCSLDASKKKDDIYINLADHNLIPDYIDTVFTTDLFSAGLNINNTGDWHIIIIGFKDPTIIKQFVARLRNVEKLRITIITGKSEVKEVDLDSYRSFLFRKAHERMEELNENTDAVIIKESGLLQDDVFYLDESTGEYEIVYDKILSNAWKYYVKHLSPEDYLLCFDDDGYTLEVENLEEEEYEDEIMERLQETREERKEMKEEKKAITLELLETYQDFAYASKGDNRYDEKMIDYYLHLTNQYQLPHKLVMRFCEDSDFDIKARYEIMAYFYKKKDSTKILRKNKIFNLVKFVYELRKGTEFNITEKAEQKKFKRLDLKKCIEALWDFEERTDGKKRTVVMVDKKKEKLLSLNERKILIMQGVVIDNKTLLKLL